MLGSFQAGASWADLLQQEAFGQSAAREAAQYYSTNPPKNAPYNSTNPAKNIPYNSTNPSKNISYSSSNDHRNVSYDPKNIPYSINDPKSRSYNLCQDPESLPFSTPDPNSVLPSSCQVALERCQVGLRRYECFLCQKQIRGDKQDFRRHYMTHTGEKPVACPFCSYKTITKSCLKKHILGNHREAAAASTPL